MASHHLARLAHHRPATLDVQSHPAALEAQALQVRPGMAHQRLNQRRKAGVTLQLPDAIEIASPGTTRVGVRFLPGLQLADCLHLQGRIERVTGQLHQAQGQGKEGLQLQCPWRRKGGGHRPGIKQRDGACILPQATYGPHPPLPAGAAPCPMTSQALTGANRPRATPSSDRTRGSTLLLRSRLEPWLQGPDWCYRVSRNELAQQKPLAAVQPGGLSNMRHHQLAVATRITWPKHHRPLPGSPG